METISAGIRPERLVFALRLASAVASSAAFGLAAAAAFPPWSLWSAVGLGFLFGTAFVGGTGYRILIAVASLKSDTAPASWSGAAAASALLALALWFIARWLGGPAIYVLVGYAIAINLAYLPVKGSCLAAGCCRSVRRIDGLGISLDLRQIEFGATLLVIAATLALATSFPVLAAVAGILGHLAVRLVSRRWRDRWSWGWPPLRQPGAELAPLAVLAMIAALVA